MNNDKKEEMRRRIKQTKEAARGRVVKDGTIQFRLDAANMERLLGVADDCKTGAGVLARMWVLDRLNHDTRGVHTKGAQSYSTEERLADRIVHEDAGLAAWSYQKISPKSMGAVRLPPAHEHGLLAASIDEFIALMNAQAASQNQLIQIAEDHRKEIAALKKTISEQGKRLAVLHETRKMKK